MKPSQSIAFERLHNLHLFGNPVDSPEGAVRSLVAVQAQDYAGAKWGLAERSRASDAAIEDAFHDGRILRTHLLRPTWHFVVPEDIRWLLSLSKARVLAASTAQFRKLELDDSVFKRTIKVFQKALKGQNFLDRDALRVVLEKAGVATRGDLRMSYILMQAEIEAVICSGPRMGKQFTYALLDERASNARVLSTDEALAELTQRFFATRGPATVQDFAKWSWLTLTACRKGIATCGAHLEERNIDGVSHWSLPSSTIATRDKPVAHLLSIYDECFSSYKDRSSTMRPGDGEKLVAISNALTGVVLVDGAIVGTWKRIQRKQTFAVDVSLLRKLLVREKQSVIETAERLAEFNGSKADISFTSH